MCCMAAPAITRITDDAYFELELASPAKHQLWRGELVAMAGGSPAHNVIVALPLAEVYEGTEDLMPSE